MKKVYLTVQVDEDVRKRFTEACRYNNYKCKEVVTVFIKKYSDPSLLKSLEQEIFKERYKKIGAPVKNKSKMTKRNEVESCK